MHSCTEFLGSHNLILSFGLTWGRMNEKDSQGQEARNLWSWNHFLKGFFSVFFNDFLQWGLRFSVEFEAFFCSRKFEILWKKSPSVKINCQQTSQEMEEALVSTKDSTFSGKDLTAYPSLVNQNERKTFFKPLLFRHWAFRGPLILSTF